MLFLVFYAVSMPFAGIIVEKCGPYKTITISAFLVGLGWHLSGYANNIAMLTLTYGVISGTGVGLAYNAVVATVAKWFNYKKGFAVGLTLLGFGLSPFVSAPLAQFFVSKFGVFETFKIIGIIFFAIIIIAALPFHFPPASVKKNLNLNKNKESLSLKQVFTNSKFIALWICFALGTFNGLMVVSITAPIGEELVALTPEKAAIMISLFAVFNGLGRPLFGWLTDTIGTFKTSVLSYIIIIICAIMLLNIENNIILYAITFCFLWLTLGGWLAIAPAATANFFGQKNYTTIYGTVFTAYGLGAVGGVTVSGLLRDTMGSYVYIFYPMLISACIGIIVSYLFLRIKKNTKNKNYN